MEVLNSLEEKGISIRVASPKLVMEEVYNTAFEIQAKKKKSCV